MPAGWTSRWSLQCDPIIAGVNMILARLGFLLVVLLAVGDSAVRKRRQVGWQPPHHHHVHQPGGRQWQQPGGRPWQQPGGRPWQQPGGNQWQQPGTQQPGGNQWQQPGTQQPGGNQWQQPGTQRPWGQQPPGNGDDNDFVFGRPDAAGTQRPTTPPGADDAGTTARTTVPGCQCPITYEYNPVCGQDRVTYTNESRLKCANICGDGRVVAVLHRGACIATTTPRPQAPNARRQG